mmetsp:Transcript_637/g.1178  ORF Transcript_637/g.1178 Transcript_637/m.1178 type:complete len:415 (+) Transcript_637:18-1262(+)
MVVKRDSKQAAKGLMNASEEHTHSENKPSLQQTTFEPIQLPRDQEGFVTSFPLGAVHDPDFISFFERYGFVIVENVLSSEERDATIGDIWAHIERSFGGQSIKRDDPRTWVGVRWPGGGPGLLGQALTPAAWRNRANPNLRCVFERLIGKPNLLSSVDNYGVFRPTRQVPMRVLPPEHNGCRTTVACEPTGPDDELRDLPELKTKSRWLHWDTSPFHTADEDLPPYKFTGSYEFTSEYNGSRCDGNCKIQGLVNLIEAREQDGGFLCVPGFHRHLREWAALPCHAALREQLKDTYDFVDVPAGDPMFEWVQRVPMRAGSLLVWNSDLPHCNYANDSERFRMVQYIKAFPAPCPLQRPETVKGMAVRRSAILGEMVRRLGPEETWRDQFDESQRCMLGLADYPPDAMGRTPPTGE